VATSGTVSFNLEIGDLIEEAAARAGLDVRSGFQWQGAIRTLGLILSDWASRGLNLWQIDESSVPLTTGAQQYTLDADTVDVLDMAVRDSAGVDIRVERCGVGTWAQITNKTQQQLRPTRAWVERLTGSVRVNVWPVPSNSDYTLVYWRLRRMEDAGSASNTPDVPFRLLPALTSGLAYYLSLKNPTIGMDRITMLGQIYENEMQRAQSEDRGRESFYIGIYSG